MREPPARVRGLFARPDRRLQREIEALRAELDQAGDVPAAARARERLAKADEELEHPWDGNEEAWACLHDARREAFELLPVDKVPLRELALLQEADQKLSGWRHRFVSKLPEARDVAEQRGHLVEIQFHLDKTFENDNRKRRHRRRQLAAYLTILAATVLVLVWLEFTEHGLLLADDDTADGWWVVTAVAYGTLGGAFSAAQRVASSPPAAAYPEMRWAQIATSFRPLAGGAGALIAFAALEVGLLGSDVNGPRLALAAFVAGFSERFVASLAKDS